MSELIDKYFAGEMTCEEKKDLFDRIESDEERISSDAKCSGVDPNTLPPG